MLLLYLYDRLFWLTIFYTLFIYITYSVLPRSGASPLISNILTFTLLGTYIVKTIDHLDRERRIRKLGKRATSIRSHWPLNTGLIYEALWYFSHHRNHEFWWKMFKQNEGKQFPYTVEGITIGGRIVFTADEENVKAILATQFADYGKGPQFRKEWKDFLGLSKSRSFICFVVLGGRMLLDMVRRRFRMLSAFRGAWCDHHMAIWAVAWSCIAVQADLLRLGWICK